MNVETTITLKGTFRHIKSKVQRSLISLNLTGTIQKFTGLDSSFIRIVAVGLIKSVFQFIEDFQHDLKTHYPHVHLKHENFSVNSVYTHVTSNNLTGVCILPSGNLIF